MWSRRETRAASCTREPATSRQPDDEHLHHRRSLAELFCKVLEVLIHVFRLAEDSRYHAEERVFELDHFGQYDL